MKRRYDFAVSLGGTCTAAESLRRAGMQFASMPFDWAGGEVLRDHAEVIAGDFKDFMPFEELEYRGPNEEKNGDIYYNRRNGIAFYHDFPYQVPLTESYPALKAKYDRRISRFIERMEKGGAVLAMFVQAPGKPLATDGDIEASRRRLQERFPAAEIDLLYVHLVQDVVFSPELLKEVAPHAYRIGFDIAMPGFYDARVADRRVIVPMLKALVPEGAVDYRTDEERAQWRIVERRKQMSKMHAKNRWEYLVNNFRWRMFRHFRNRLEKLGFENLPSHRA